MSEKIAVQGGNIADAFEWAVRCGKCREWIPVKDDILDSLERTDHICFESLLSAPVSPPWSESGMNWRVHY